MIHPSQIKSKSIREILENPTNVHGGRHDECLRVCTYLVGEGFDPHDIQATLEHAYPAIRDRNRKEIATMIEGNLKRGLTPSAARTRDDIPDRKVSMKGFKVGTYMTPLKIDDSPTDYPTPIKDGALQFLKAVFRSGELIAIEDRCNQDSEGKWKLAGGGIVLPLSRWEQRIESLYKSQEGGVWVRVNPMKPEGRSDKDVTDHRHVLVEWDNIPKTRQWEIIKKSKLPVAACIDSGGDSLHFWIKVNAPDKAEYDKRVAKIYSYLAPYGLCESNKNPSRFSRLAGKMRGEKEQSLMCLDMGFANYDEWEIEMDSSELPEEVRIDELDAFDRTNDPNNVLGNRWLCKGGTAIIQAQSGIGKSTLATQAAISWAIGRDLFGIKSVKPLKIAIIQAENDLGDLAEQFQDSTAAMELSPDEKSLLKSNLRYFMEQVRTGDDFIRMAKNIIKKTNADLVIADPLLAYIGGDISQAEVIAKFLRNGLNAVLKETGAVWMWIHHMGKPKERKDGQTSSDLAYSGLGSSDLTNWARETITLQRDSKSKEMLFDLILSKRGKRAGLTDSMGKVCTSIKIKHSDTGITWERIKSHKLAKGQSSGGIDYKKLRTMPNLNQEDALRWIAATYNVNEEESFKIMSKVKDVYFEYDSEQKTYRGKK